MSDKQLLKEALIKKDIDTVISLTGLSYEAAADKCEEAASIEDDIMAYTRSGQDTSFFEEKLSNLVENLLTHSR